MKKLNNSNQVINPSSYHDVCTMEIIKLIKTSCERLSFSFNRNDQVLLILLLSLLPSLSPISKMEIRELFSEILFLVSDYQGKVETRKKYFEKQTEDLQLSDLKDLKPRVESTLSSCKQIYTILFYTHILLANIVVSFGGINEFTERIIGKQLEKCTLKDLLKELGQKRKKQKNKNKSGQKIEYYAFNVSIEDWNQLEQLNSSLVYSIENEEKQVLRRLPSSKEQNEEEQQLSDELGQMLVDVESLQQILEVNEWMMNESRIGEVEDIVKQGEKSKLLEMDEENSERNNDSRKGQEKKQQLRSKSEGNQKNRKKKYINNGKLKLKGQR